MNKKISTLLVGSIAAGSIVIGGLNLAAASGDDEYRGEHQGKYCKHGDKGHKMGHHKKGMKHRIKRMIKHLELNEEQTKKVKAVFDRYDDRLDKLRYEKKDNRKALRDAMHADKQDMSAIKQLAKKQGELKTQKIIIRAKIKSEINSILTEKQRDEMKDMREKYGKGKYKHYRHHD